MACEIHNKVTGKTKQVKNLGWILKNAYRCESVEIFNGTDGSDLYLVFHIYERGIPIIEYRTDWASKSVFDKFWNRSRVLKHITQNWNGYKETK